VPLSPVHGEAGVQGFLEAAADAVGDSHVHDHGPGCDACYFDQELVMLVGGGSHKCGARAPRVEPPPELGVCQGQVDAGHLSNSWHHPTHLAAAVGDAGW
jgi:hypothetical protein